MADDELKTTDSDEDTTPEEEWISFEQPVFRNDEETLRRVIDALKAA